MSGCCRIAPLLLGFRRILVLLPVRTLCERVYGLGRVIGENANSRPIFLQSAPKNFYITPGDNELAGFVNKLGGSVDCWMVRFYELLILAKKKREKKRKNVALIFYRAYQDILQHGSLVKSLTVAYDYSSCSLCHGVKMLILNYSA